MNERIKELAIQVMHSDPEPHLTTELYSFTKSEFEKFAELIVRECSQFVEDKFDFCGDELIIAEQILKHFGVEE